MDKSFEVYHGGVMSTWMQGMTRRRIDWLCENAVGTVLDVGCSQAVVPYLLAQKGHEVVGIDRDSEAIAWARQNLAKCEEEVQKNITLHEQDFETFEIQQKFTTIIAAEYLEHLTDAQLQSHLKKIRTLLTQDGIFLCTTPLGIHPHADHHQTFFLRNFVELIKAFFSIEQLAVHDGYIRCACRTSSAHKQPTATQLLDLYEQSIAQIQERYLGTKKDSPSDTSKQKDVIEDYLHITKTSNSSSLKNWLMTQGFTEPFTYDVRLFSALNTWYADKPLVPSPRKIAAPDLFSQADTRVNYLLTLLPSFAGLKCLEVGCGRGETAVRLAERGLCSVTGVDITRYPEWSERWSNNTKFLPIDITHEAPFLKESLDFIYSFVVLEHVADPLQMISTMYGLLKPGGLLYFTANLYRGPMASHRYREVFFPWPHLLFDDNVFDEYYKQQGYKFRGTPAWVNKLTHLHYIDCINKLGCKKHKHVMTKKSLDIDFYSCFSERLGKYPMQDLEYDFIKMNIEK